jgi:hypothetical protein
LKKQLLDELGPIAWKLFGWGVMVISRWSLTTVECVHAIGVTRDIAWLFVDVELKNVRGSFSFYFFSFFYFSFERLG